MGIYEDWIMENPYDEGQGWGHVPWCQKEMDVTEEMLDCARRNDVLWLLLAELRVRIRITMRRLAVIV